MKSKNNGKRWNIADEFEVVILCAANVPLADIAEKLGRSETAVASRIHNKILKRSGNYKNMLICYLVYRVPLKVYDWKAVERFRSKYKRFKPRNLAEIANAYLQSLKTATKSNEKKP